MSESKHTILCVDDEENILQSLKRLLRKEDYRLLTARSAQEGLEILGRETVHLVISDQRMPEMSGVEFLARINEEYPDVIRVVLTGYTDVDSITESINKGHIYKFLLKPWNDQDLKLDIRQTLEQYDLILANRLLNERVLEQNERLRHMNQNLEQLVEARTRELELQNHALELSRVILEDLPLAVVGMSAEGTVALANRGALMTPGFEDPIEMGKRVSDCFCAEAEETAGLALESGRPALIEHYRGGDATFDIRVTPLAGRFRGKGVILTWRLPQDGSSTENS